MRAGESTFVALNADARVPHRYFKCDISLFPLSRGRRPGAVDRECANREQISLSSENCCRHTLHEVRRFCRNQWGSLMVIIYAARHTQLLHIGDGLVDRCHVLAHEFSALLAVSVLDSSLNFVDRPLRVENLG